MENSKTLSKKNSPKRVSLVNATIDLVISNGVHAAPMAQIAKLAKVSPGTIYLYFESKQDLLNKVYVEVKKEFTAYAFAEYSRDMPIKDGFKHIWHNIARFKLEQNREALFLNQCETTPIVDDVGFKEGLKHFQPLLDLWSKGIDEKYIKPISPFLLYAYSIYPLTFLITMKQRGLITITKTDLKHAFDSAWNSIELKH